MPVPPRQRYIGSGRMRQLGSCGARRSGPVEPPGGAARHQKRSRLPGASAAVLGRFSGLRASLIYYCPPAGDTGHSLPLLWP
jgi:hypothetical protein